MGIWTKLLGREREVRVAAHSMPQGWARHGTAALHGRMPPLRPDCLDASSREARIRRRRLRGERKRPVHPHLPVCRPRAVGTPPAPDRRTQREAGSRNGDVFGSALWCLTGLVLITVSVMVLAIVIINAISPASVG